MRRFNDEDNDDREDVDNFFNGAEDSILTPEEYKKLAEEEQAIQYAQLAVVSRDLNRRLLARAISMCEKSFWWRFYSLETQLNRVSAVYKSLRKLEGE